MTPIEYLSGIECVHGITRFTSGGQKTLSVIDYLLPYLVLFLIKIFRVTGLLFRIIGCSVGSMNQFISMDTHHTMRIMLSRK